jgi:hypothetical protein
MAQFWTRFVLRWELLWAVQACRKRDMQVILRLEELEPREVPATLVVNMIQDPSAPTPRAPGLSLREAIECVNAQGFIPGLSESARKQITGTWGKDDTILFNIGEGTQTIKIYGTPLPAITKPVTINGLSATLEDQEIVIDGSQLPEGKTTMA